MAAQKKIGIITMHRINNYGSVLQAFALQYIVKKMGFDVQIIDYDYPNSFQYARGVALPKNDWKAKVIKSMFWLHPYNRYDYKFQDFRNCYFRLSPYYKDFDAIHQKAIPYDLYITGSDQVWNPNFTKGDTTFLLDFAGKSANKISYASSFSCTQLGKEYEAAYSELLSQYQAISVREYGGVELVKQLTGKQAVLTVDPTLLLDGNDWRTIAGKQNQYNKGYILLYVLSYSFNPVPYIYDLALYLSKKLNLPIVVLGKHPYLSKYKNVESILDAGPLEFLQLIENAVCVVTSSFHGTAFSVNYKKPVYAVVNNKNDDDRISSFLSDVSLDKSIISVGTPLETIPLDMHSESSWNILNQKREYSLSYLENAINANIE